MRCLRETTGAALLMAMMLLALFTALGMVYVRHMELDTESSNYALREMRARTLAEAGINAALADLERARHEDQVKQWLGRTQLYEFGTYLDAPRGDMKTLPAREDRRAQAAVTVVDESGKINLNHAPEPLLMSVLGVDAETAKKIRASLPLSQAEDKTPRQWLVDVDDLVSNGLLSEEQFSKLDRTLFSTDSVANHLAPGAYLNLNAAPVGVLAAVLNMSREDAEKVAVKRPFKSFTDVVTASGKDPSTFAIKPEPAAPERMPQPLTLESRSFRLSSEATYGVRDGKYEHNTVKSKVEAVVALRSDGTPRIVRWIPQHVEKEAAAK